MSPRGKAARERHIARQNAAHHAAVVATVRCPICHAAKGNPCSYVDADKQRIAREPHSHRITAMYRLSDDAGDDVNEADRSRLWRGVFDDGSELLVTAWPHADGREVLEVAVRRPGERCWGPPVHLVEEQ